MCWFAALGAAMGASAATATAVGAITTASLAGTALSTYGAYQQSKSAKDAANYNATVAEYAAQDAQARGEQEAMKARQQADQVRGSQRAAMAARGLDLGEGTPLALLDQTDYFAAQDQATIRSNAAKEAWSKRAQSTGYRNEASGYSPLLSGASTMLTGVGSVASQWYQRSASAQPKAMSWSEG